jgi:type VI secretion system protein VasD
MKRYLPALCLAVVLLCLAGCGKPRLDLNMASQPNVNPDNSGRPSPVLVKTYELRNDLVFNQSDFQSLFERPVPTLGADLVAADELVLIPGEARKVTYTPSANTRFLGVVAGFRQMERAQWRMIKPVDPEKKNTVALEFNDASILIVPDAQAGKWEPEEAVRQFQQQMSRPVPPLPQEQSDVSAPPAPHAPVSVSPSAHPSGSF